MNTILFWCSAHGNGHINRLRTLLPHLKKHIVLAVHSDEPIVGYPNVINIPNTPFDNSGICLYNPSCFHPIPLKDNTKHFLPLIQAINEYKPDIAVIDVSVEAALLTRLMGIPYIYIRQSGNRYDLPHKLVYQAAIKVIAPYILPMEDVSYKYVDKTTYVGGLSRFLPRKSKSTTKPPKVIIVLPGRGGTNLHPDIIIDWAKHTPQYHWIPLCEGPINPYVIFIGYKSNVEDYLDMADVVVGNAGDNIVMEVGAFKKPFVCIPDHRPFGEQYSKAAGLSMMDVAKVCTYPPQGQDMQQLIEAATLKDLSRWDDIVSPTSAQDFVSTIESCILLVKEQLNLGFQNNPRTSS